MADLITPEALRTAHWELIAQIRFSGGAYMDSHRCSDFPELTSCRGRDPGRDGQHYRHMYLAGDVVPWGAWSTIAQRLNALRARQAAAA